MFALWPWELSPPEAILEIVLVVCCVLTIVHALRHELHIWVLLHLLSRFYSEVCKESRLVSKGAACFPNNVFMYEECVPLFSQELQYAFWPYIDILVVWRLGFPRLFRPVAVSFFSYLPHIAWALTAPVAGFGHYDISSLKKAVVGKKSVEFLGTGHQFFWWQTAPLHAFWMCCGFEFAYVLSERWQGFRSPIGVSPYPRIHPWAQVLMVAFGFILDMLDIPRHIYKWVRGLKAPILIYIGIATAAIITIVGYRKRRLFHKIVLGNDDSGGKMEINVVKDHIPIVMLMIWHCYLLLAFLAGCEGIFSPPRWPSSAGKNAKLYRSELMTNANVYVSLAALCCNFVVQRFVYIKAFEENWGFLVMKDEKLGFEANEEEKKDLERRFMAGRTLRKPSQARSGSTSAPVID